MAEKNIYDTHSCELCDEIDCDEMVACDLCSRWYHFSCVGIESIGEKDDFVCPLCKDEVNQQSSNSSTRRSTSQPKVIMFRPPNSENEVVVTTSYLQISSPSLTSRSVRSEMDDQFQERNLSITEPTLSQSQQRITLGGQRFNAFSMRYVQSCNYPRMTSDSNRYLPTIDPFIVRQRQQLSTMRQGNNPIGIIPIRNIYSFPAYQRIEMQQPMRMMRSNQFQMNTSFQVRNRLPNENSVCNSTFQRDQTRNPVSSNPNDTTFDMPRRIAERVRRIHLSTASVVSNLRSSEHSSEMSSMKSTISSRRQIIELARIEEERVLQEKRDNDYLNQKYSLLLDECESGNVSNFTDRSKFTEDWVNRKHHPGTPVHMPTSVREVDTNEPRHTEFERKLEKVQFDTKSPMTTTRPAGIQGTVQAPLNFPFNLNQSTKLQGPTLNSDDQCTLTKAQIAARHVVAKNLPSFSGNPEEWPMFICRFNNSTRLCGFTDQENLDRLQMCLKGKALEAVRCRLLTGTSVTDIINILQMLFGRPELVINALLNNIRQEPPPKADRLDSLVDFAMKVGNLNAVMVQSGLRSHLNNPTVLKELVDKLPPTFKIEWARFRQLQIDPDLSTFGTWIHQLAETISLVTEPTTSKQSENKCENKSKKDSTNNGDIHLGSQVFVHKEVKDNRCPICRMECESLELCSVFLSYDVDRRWKELKNNNLCRKCLRRHDNYCQTNKQCGTNGCIFRHHSLLHDSKKHSEKLQSSVVQPVTSSNNTHKTFSTRILLRILPVTVFYGDVSVSTFAYLDDGSDITMIDASVIHRMGIRGTPEPLCLLWTGDVHRQEKNSLRVTFCISGFNHSKQYCLRDVRTVEALLLRKQSLVKSKIVEKFDYLRDVPFEDYYDAIPEILIGSDNVSLIAPLEIVEGEFNQPIATRSRLGWSIYGDVSYRSHKSPEAIVNPHNSICPYNTTNYDEIHRQVKDFFTLENFGVQRNVTLISKEDERALELLKKYTKRLGNHFETALLWRYDSIQLPDSYDMAFKRLKCLENHKPGSIKIINDTITDYIGKGYVSKLGDEMTKIESPVWYLPIFAVSHPKKPEKIRTVFDAAAISKGVSLNSMLLRGPDQLASLTDILRRFREKRIAIAGDIKEMFHQVKIRDEDKHSQRFLWRNGDQTRKPEQYVMNVMTFGAKCSPSAAQFVKNLNASEFKEKYPQAVNAIVNNHYVDDWLDGEDDEDSLNNLINEVIKIHSHGGFEMRNFLSNSIEIKKRFGGRPNDGKNLNLEINHGTERVLGMWWDTESDKFTFSLKFFQIDQGIIDQLRMPTKREVLKILMSVFDPLGFLSHYLIHLKILLQEVWRSQLNWDEELNTVGMKFAWVSWFELLPKVEEIRIPRLVSSKISPNTSKSNELHVFVDASEQAFSAVAFLRIESDDGIECRLIGSKARVAPLKHLSIPRLELQAGVLGTRLLLSICNGQTLKIDKRQIWTDSSTLLSWIRSDQRKYHQFVANRIGEILESTDIHEWRWVPSDENVADDATKWKTTPSFQQSNRWFAGPSFLRLSPDQWPKQGCKAEADTTEEMRAVLAHGHLAIPIFINPERFSSWKRMHRSMAFVVRYVRNLYAKVHRKLLMKGTLTQSELLVSEKIIIRQAQFEDFTEEFIILKRNNELQLSPEKELAIPKSSRIYTCSPYLDSDDLIRIRSRIDLATNVPYNTRRPIIMPKDHRITRLLVDDYHRMYHHRNDRTVHNEICQKFFIQSIRVIIRSTRNECQRCKNRQAKPLAPEMANLPMPRLAIGFRAFTYIGIDYFGPIFVAVGRSSVKRWGMLITCLTVRAINIEIVYKANTESCIMGIRNHINEYGQPEEIFSDPGSNFKGTNNELQKFIAEIDHMKMANEFTTICTKWNFNPPVSPHMGGAWERMIRSVKSMLYDILPAQNLTDDALRNLVLEVVNVVNSRPLSYVPLDNDGDEVLTPNHFIKGSSNGIKPMVDMELGGPILRCKWKENQRLMDLFWEKFIKEFLPELTRKAKWFEPVAPLQVNDIVLIIDKTNKRNVYPKARIIEVVSDSRGQVRRARVQRAEGSALWRSAHGLAKLDVHKEVSDAPEDIKTRGSVKNVSTDRAKVVPEAKKNGNTISEN